MSTLELSELLGNYGEFVGAIAIVITLIYLAIQLKQNTASVRANAHQTVVAATTSHYGTAQNNDSMSRTIADGLKDPASLTENNWVQFAFWCHQFVLIGEATYYLRQDRVINESVFQTEVDRVATFLSGPAQSQWWAAGARTQFSTDFVAMIEDLMGKPTQLKPYAFTEGRGFYQDPQYANN